MKQLWNRLKSKLINYETISYLIFGVLTTLVDWISYGVMTRFWNRSEERRVGKEC